MRPVSDIDSESKGGRFKSINNNDKKETRVNVNMDERKEKKQRERDHKKSKSVPETRAGVSDVQRRLSRRRRGKEDTRETVCLICSEEGKG